MSTLFTGTCTCGNGYRGLNEESRSAVSIIATHGRHHRPLIADIWRIHIRLGKLMRSTSHEGLHLSITAGHRIE